MVRIHWALIVFVLAEVGGAAAPRELSEPRPGSPTPEARKESPGDVRPARGDAPGKQPKAFAIWLELESPGTDAAIEWDTAFRVVLVNESDRPLRIWRTDSRQGWNQLSVHFLSLRTGKTHVARRRVIDGPEFWKSASHRRDPDASVAEIGTKQSRVERIKLSEIWGERVWEGLPSPNTDDRFEVRVRFESRPTDDSRRLGVWCGALTSEPVRARFTAEKLTTPHRLLWNGFADAAIDMMAKAPAWIGKIDNDQCTPLHHAARFGPPSAVQWLLDHQADVNAGAYNGFTPLHLADDPEIVRLILTKKPDLAIHRGGQSPPQRAAEALSSAKSDTERVKWRCVLDAYRNAGVPCDALMAIHLDDLASLVAILKSSPGLADDFHGQSLLRTAAKLGRLSMCEFLIKQYKVDVNDFERGAGYPIIQEAVPYPRIVKLLIDHGADLKTRITWRGGRTGVWIVGDDATALHYAAQDGAPETITLLLDRGVDPFAVARDVMDDGKQQVALEVAAFFGRADQAAAIVKHPKFASAALVIRQPILDRCLWQGASPTWLARNPQRLKLIQVLLDAGANPNVRRDGMTALQIAASSIAPDEDEGNVELKAIVALLRKRGAALDFFSAVAIGDLAQVRAMLAQDPKRANTLGHDGYPAIHFAIRMDERETVNSLLVAGCDVNLRNKSDLTETKQATPLHSAAFWDRAEIASRLIAAKANVHALDEHRFTPLHEAVRAGSLPVVKLLVQSGARLDARDDNGKTPLDWCLSGFDAAEVRRFLQEAGTAPKR